MTVNFPRANELFEFGIVELLIVEYDKHQLQYLEAEFHARVSRSILFLIIVTRHHGLGET